MGSGPGGLGCAYHLRRMGYASVIFEALDKPGGMLRAGIPAWHLPGEVLDAEIAKLLDLGGIEIRCGARVGGPDGELTLDELADRHDAVFLALGQDVGRRLEAEGAQARGVIGALEFLRETGLGRPVQSGKNVLVIGGGNTASDAARSAIRLGGDNAESTIVSLEAEAELLIVAEDLAQAREEGVRFRPQTALVRDPPRQPGHRGHPGLQPRGGARRGGSLHVLRGLQRLRQLLHRVARRQRDAGCAGERALLHPHPLLQGLPGLRAGVPHRLPGAGAGAGLRRAGRRGPHGDRVRALRRRARRAGPVHPPAHRGRDRRVRRLQNTIKFSYPERAGCHALTSAASAPDEG
ncbi:MAG: FAD-dependent oxidoreductase [Streptosporangiaceae bacterium]